jgi:SAM-dependent methyltransferase
MKDWRIFVSDTFVKWWKQLGVLGWIRFRILRIAYKIFWTNSPRNGEWDFVLSWMKPLREWQKPVFVLDVGSTESLLIYELSHRGYEILGIDQRDYQEPNKNTIIFDLLNPYQVLTQSFDYVIAISTIEHIGLGAYGDNQDNNGDKKALGYLHSCLKENGYFIITIPNKHLGTATGRGYSYQKFEELIKGLFKIVNFEERSNQICAVLVKCQ